MLAAKFGLAPAPPAGRTGAPQQLRAPWSPGRGALAPLVAWVLVGCATQRSDLGAVTLLAERGQEREAIELLEQHLQEHPEAVQQRQLLIRLHASTGRLDLARAEAERLADFLPPDSPLPWIELGHALELAHRYEEALAAFDRAAEVAPRDAAGAKRGGLRAARWGELELAEPRLAEAARRDPADSETWHALGLVRLGLGALDSAREAYLSALAANPRAVENHLGLATVALRSERPELALEQYDQLLAERPDYTDAWLGKSWCLIRLGNFMAARVALERARELGADPRVVGRQHGVIKRLEQQAR